MADQNKAPKRVCATAYHHAKCVAVHCIKCEPDLAPIALHLMTRLELAMNTEAREHPLPKLSKRAVAMALLIQNPEWSDSDIAKAAGCSRAYLYQIPQYVAAREAMKGGRDKYGERQHDAES
jgi:AraC-like DNA-binding protein